MDTHSVNLAGGTSLPTAAVAPVQAPVVNELLPVARSAIAGVLSAKRAVHRVVFVRSRLFKRFTDESYPRWFELLNASIVVLIDSGNKMPIGESARGQVRNTDELSYIEQTSFQCLFIEEKPKFSQISENDR